MSLGIDVGFGNYVPEPEEMRRREWRRERSWSMPDMQPMGFFVRAVWFSGVVSRREDDGWICFIFLLFSMSKAAISRLLVAALHCLRQREG